MLANGEASARSLVPLMRYRDVSAAVDWLCDAFEFERHSVVHAADGTIFYAQLTFGNGMVMLGPVRSSELDELMRQPDEIGGMETQNCYLVVEDVDAHYAKAISAGAEIVFGLNSDDSGGRGYSCRDPQGHIWNFGTYNPWKGKSPAYHGHGERASTSGWRRPAVKARLFFAGAVLAIAVLWATGLGQEALNRLVAANFGGGSAEQDALESATPGKDAEAAFLRPGGTLPEALDRLVAANFGGGSAEQDALESATPGKDAEAAFLRPGGTLPEALAREQSAKRAAEGAFQAVQQELARERRARTDAEAAARQLETRLAAERGAREAAINGAARLEAELAKERNANAALKQEMEDRGQRSAAPSAGKEAAPRAQDGTGPRASESPAPGAGAETAPSQQRTEGVVATSSTTPLSEAAPARRVKRARYDRVGAGKSKSPAIKFKEPWPFSDWLPQRAPGGGSAGLPFLLDPRDLARPTS